MTGSSRGIGRTIAQRLAKSGARVVIHGHRGVEEANSVAASITADGGVAEVMMADLASADARSAFIESAWQWQSGVDIWVNNAGADVLTGDGREGSFAEKLEALWQVDVLGSLDCSRRIGRRMKTAGRGVMITIGWDQAWQGMAGDSGEMFAAVKGAIMCFTKSLAKSLAPEVRVNCVAPGWIKTAWGDTADPYWQQRAIGESLRGRWGTPGDVAEVVHFLASPAADFVNAQVLEVNGGFRNTPGE